MKKILLLLLISNISWAAFLPKSFTIDFEQKFISRVRKTEKVSNGILKYKYPGQIYFDVKDPDKILYISNGKKTWLYRPPFMKGENGSVEVFSSKKSEASKFFDTLIHGLKNNDLYKVKRTGFRVRLIFTPKMKKQLGIKEALLFFKPDSNFMFSQLQKLTWIYPGSKPPVDLYIKKIEANSKFKSNQFKFSPPKNTTINKR